jgi:hypothetical protein
MWLGAHSDSAIAKDAQRQINKVITAGCTLGDAPPGEGGIGGRIPGDGGNGTEALTEGAPLPVGPSYPGRAVHKYALALVAVQP